MVSEYLVKQTIRIFYEIARKLINQQYCLPCGGEPQRIVRSALQKIEKKYGSLSAQRIVDYVVCSAYAFKSRGDRWKINQVFGPKSITRFNSDQGRIYFEDEWLASAGLSRMLLSNTLLDRSVHPKAKYIFVTSEEGTKLRLLNKEIGYAICQASTLGWSPLSSACAQCCYAEKCQIETQKKYPEIYRLRIEYVNK